MAVAKKPSSENIKEEGPGTIVNIVRLLLSSLHAWNLDDQLDQSCEETLGLVRPCRPVSFGLMSKGECMSLVLPGWGLRSKQRLDTHSLSASGKGEEIKIERELDVGDKVVPDQSPDIKSGTQSPDVSSQQESSHQPESVYIQPNLTLDIQDPKRSLESFSSSPYLGRSISRQTSSGFTFDQKYHVRWQLSRSLTTQHLLTMVSITNTLMNQVIILIVN